MDNKKRFKTPVVITFRDNQCYKIVIRNDYEELPGIYLISRAIEEYVKECGLNRVKEIKQIEVQKKYAVFQYFEHTFGFLQDFTNELLYHLSLIKHYPNKQARNICNELIKLASSKELLESFILIEDMRLKSRYIDLLLEYLSQTDGIVTKDNSRKFKKIYTFLGFKKMPSLEQLQELKKHYPEGKVTSTVS